MVPCLQHHFDIVTSEDVAQFPELFGAIGEAFYERKMYDSALDVYQLMAENEEVGSNSPTLASATITSAHLGAFGARVVARPTGRLSGAKSGCAIRRPATSNPPKNATRTVRIPSLFILRRYDR